MNEVILKLSCDYTKQINLQLYVVGFRAGHFYENSGGVFLAIAVDWYKERQNIIGKLDQLGIHVLDITIS